MIALMRHRTSEITFTTSPTPLTLPPNSIQTVRVTGIAPEPGTLQLRGVSFRLFEGSTSESLLPVLGEKDKQQKDKRRSRLSSEMSKIKCTGLDARFSQYTEASDEVSETWLECTVVEEQPLLWIRKTSLTHGTVMLYNGET